MATDAYLDLPVSGGGSGVTSLNSLTGILNIVAGTGISVTPAGSSITIAATGAGTGTVTSVDMTVPAFLAISGNPITTAGTLALTLSGTALPVANGGTSLTTLTNHNVMLGAGTSAPTFVAPSTSGNVLTSDGTTWISQAPAASGITAGTGDVTFSGSGSVATTVAKIAGVAVGTPTGSGNVVFSASPTLTGTITAAAITASGKITSSSATSFTASGSTYTYDMTATTSLFGRVSTAADTGTITLQSNTALNSDTHGGASIKITANDGVATDAGSIDISAYGSGGSTTNQVRINCRVGSNATNTVATFVNGGMLVGSGKAIQLQGAGTFTGGTGLFQNSGINTFLNHGIYCGNSAATAATSAFSRFGFGFSGDLAGATQYGFWNDPGPTAAATTQWSSIYTYVNGKTGTITFTEMNGLFIDQPNILANNTATRMNQIRIFPANVPVAGTITNSASITDNVAYTGTWFINQSGTQASSFGGIVNLVNTTAAWKTAAGNETTGAGTALLGANSPAVTNTAPYVWLKVQSSDGSTVYVPAWK